MDEKDDRFNDDSWKYWEFQDPDDEENSEEDK